MSIDYNYLKKIGEEEEKRLKRPHLNNDDIVDNVKNIINLLKNDNDIINLRRDDYNKFYKIMTDRFNIFSKKYPSIFFKFIKENNLTKLDEYYDKLLDMLQVRSQVLNETITKNEGDFKIKNDLDQEYVNPIVEKLEQKQK
jgi:hypothetical protein